MKTIRVEMLKIFKSKVIFIAIFISILAGSAMTYVAYNNPDAFQFRHTQAFYAAYFMLVFIIYIIIENIYVEHKHSTIKLIINKNTSISKLIISKLLAFQIIGFFLALVNIVFNIIVYQLLKPDINLLMFALQRIVLYASYVFVVFAVAVLIYSIDKNSMMAITILVLLFYISRNIIDLIVAKIHISETVLDFIPFYSLSSGMQGLSFSLNMIIGSLILGIIILQIGIKRLSKQDIL